ncbi:MAG: sulfite exporter TauE/SafE family protein, partial [Thermodesulfovibrionales bacterium]
MKRFIVSMAIALSAALFMLYQNGAFAEKPKEAKAQPAAEAVKAEDKKAEPALNGIIAQIDKTSLSNGGTITVTGTAPAGKPVYIEVWADKKVRASRFDSEVDKETGKRPYIFYMTNDMPAYYKLFMPVEFKEALQEIKKEGKKWSVSKALKNTGADAVYSAPAKAKIDRYQANLMGSIIGSRGDLLPEMDNADTKRRSMQLLKARFRDLDKVFGADVNVNEDGTYKAEIKIRQGLAPGKYTIVAAVDKNTKSQPVTFENNINFPHLYLSNAGTSVNLFGPFLLTLCIAIFGVLMGAGGGFIMNPLLVSIWPLPHTVVA